MAKYGVAVEKTIPTGAFANVKVRVWAEFDDADLEGLAPSPQARMEYVRLFVRAELDKAIQTIANGQTTPAKELPGVV